MAAHQAPPSLGFSRQEHWSGLPFPSPMHESEKWKWSRSVVSDSSWTHGLQPTGSSVHGICQARVLLCTIAIKPEEDSKLSKVAEVLRVVFIFLPICYKGQLVMGSHIIVFLCLLLSRITSLCISSESSSQYFPQAHQSNLLLPVFCISKPVLSKPVLNEELKCLPMKKNFFFFFLITCWTLLPRHRVSDKWELNGTSPLLFHIWVLSPPQTIIYI